MGDAQETHEGGESPREGTVLKPDPSENGGRENTEREGGVRTNPKGPGRRGRSISSRTETEPLGEGWSLMQTLGQGWALSVGYVCSRQCGEGCKWWI